MRPAPTLAPSLALAAALLAGPALADAPEVLADTPAVHSLVAQVMAGQGTPGLLLDRGADPHSFQLRPSQTRALAGADLMFWIGPELTPWLERALAGTPPRGEAVALLHAEGVAVRRYGAAAEAHHEDAHGHAEDHADGHDDHAHDDHHDDHEDGHDHAHGDADDHDHDGDHAHEDDHDHAHAHDGADPHAWLDPAVAAAWVGVIAAHLAEADPANAGAYAANAAAARAGLEALAAEVAATLAPVGEAPIYVFHDAYGYFAAAFGLNVAGTLALGDAADPGAARLSAVRAALRDEGAACVFAEAEHNPGYVANVVEGTGIRTGLLDPTGTLIEPGPELYGTLMRGLARAIADCVTGAG